MLNVTLLSAVVARVNESTLLVDASLAGMSLLLLATFGLVFRLNSSRFPLPLPNAPIAPIPCVRLHPLARAAFTGTFLGIDSQVFAGVRVPTWAMCLRRVLRRLPTSAQHVFPNSHGTDVGWIAAERVVADEVVEDHPSRDRADFRLIAKAVNATRVAYLRKVHHPVTAVSKRPLPEMAPVLRYNPSDVGGLLPFKWGGAEGDERSCRYSRILNFPFLRRHFVHLPSGSRFPASRWPAAQCLRFMPCNVTRIRATHKGPRQYSGFVPCSGYAARHAVSREVRMAVRISA